MNPFRRITACFHRSRLDREMAEEMAAHLERETEQNLTRGLPPDEARFAARRAFGGVDQLQERERDARGLRWLEDTWRDARHAARSLRQSPAFTTVAVVSLAIGIGACTSVFTAANAILLRSLPVPNPQELRVLHWSGTQLHIPSWSGGDTAFPPPLFFHLREQAAGQADLFGFVPLHGFVAEARGKAFTADGAMVSDNFFSGLEVRPLFGRTLGARGDFAGSGPAAVLSYRLWADQFASDPSVLGETITINRKPFTIVGILPQGFRGAQAGQPADFYVPLAPKSPFLYRAITSNFHWYVRVLARLRPGTSAARLRATLQVAWAHDAATFMQHPRLRLEAGSGGESPDRLADRKPLLLLLGIAATVMLIACANLAGLALARGAARRHEFAVRAALGSGRARLIRRSLIESLLLGVLGSGLGLLLAVWTRNSIGRLLAGSRDTLHYDFSIDRRVLAFTLAVALLTALLAGLLPALRAGRIDPIDGLKHRGALGAPRLRVGRILVAAQIGLATVLLTGAGLFVRSVRNLAGIDAGFRTDHLLLFQVNIEGSARANADPAGFYGRLQTALAALPGARAASLIGFPLLANISSSGGFPSFSHRPPRAGTTMNTRRLSVGETFFATLGIPIVDGRGFTPADAEGSPKVIVVNEAFVRKFLPDKNPLGLTIPVWRADWKIVGVCRDARYATIKAPTPPTAYFPFRQRFYSRYRTTHLRTTFFAVRTAVPPSSLVPAVRRTVASLDPEVAVTEVTTQNAVRARSVGQDHLFASLCGALAGVALLLACIGLYGLMAYDVTRRTGEIGVRMALGAGPRAIAWPLLRDALGLGAVGLAVGLPAARSLAQLIRNQLYGVAPTDPWALAVGSLLLVAVALLAAWLPARRAARVDPTVALRAE